MSKLLDLLNPKKDNECPAFSELCLLRKESAIFINAITEILIKNGITTADELEKAINAEEEKLDNF